MKKINNFLFCITVFLITVYACTTDNDEQLDKIQDFSKVGEIHNEGLDYIFSEETFSKLKSFKKEDNTVDELAIARTVFDQTNEYLKGRSVVVDGVTIQLEPMKDFNEFYTVYTNAELGVYSEVDAVEIADPDEVLRKIDLIVEDYAAKPEAEDYEIVMSTGSVYKSSVEYWSEPIKRSANFSKYEKLGWFNWAAFGMADASGAWGGAKIGAVGGAAGAIGGAIAFGLCNSALNAAVQAAWHEANQ